MNAPRTAPAGRPGAAVRPGGDLARPGRELVPVSEFGPFDLLGTWAHATYINGRYEQSIKDATAALALVEAAGDRISARYLRYIRCLNHEMLGQWSALRQRTEELLEGLDPAAGPYWRAKLLGVKSHALIVQGSPGAALDSLAEAYGLVTELPGDAYNRGSACHVVAISLSSALLFGPALKLLRTAQAVLGPRSGGDVNGAIEESMLLATWGLFLEFLGRDREAEARFAASASAAIRGVELTVQRGLAVQELQTRSMLEFAYQRLGSGREDLHVIRSYLDRDNGRDALIPRMALASAQARGGDLEGAREATARIRADARRFGEPVLAWVATAWLAELEEHAHGQTEATRRWRALALTTMERLWWDRAGRFEHLVARHRVATLSAKIETEHDRLWEDALTSVGNRRMLDELLTIPRASARPVAFVDVDRFKSVNDRYGHEVGDEVLRRIAVLLRALCRAGDAVIRYGGDEFVVLLAEDGDVEVLAGRIRASVSRFSWDDIAPGLHVTVSVGTSPGGPRALERADAELLAAKAALV